MRLRLRSLRINSLRAALIFDLTVIGISAAALFAVVLSLMIQRSFGVLETAEVGRDIDRARAALNAELRATEAHVMGALGRDLLLSPGFQSRVRGAQHQRHLFRQCRDFLRGLPAPGSAGPARVLFRPGNRRARPGSGFRRRGGV